tara:strand:+ start:394 stop:651 length:258 start_codon:yes stop_codon:yes gene_type:complete
MKMDNINMITKRNYKLTPEDRSFGTTWKVEMWNDFGMKRTVYERNIMDASEVVMDWWESSEEEFDKMNSLSNCLSEMYKNRENGK